MTYIKLYEDYRENYSINDWLCDISTENDLNSEHFLNWTTYSFSNIGLTTLTGIEKFKNIVDLQVEDNKLRNLNGIENLTNLKLLRCDDNKLESLHGIENLKKIEYINCSENNLRNLDEIENLPNLKNIGCWGNDWDYPLPKKYVDKFHIAYTHTNLIHLQTYKCQKEFLDKYPERVEDLKDIGYHKDLVNDPKYAWLFDQESNGFFGLKN